MYSALKQGGKRLYELARKGETVERESRPIRIHAIEMLEIAGARLVFRVACSKGTYVRTLVEDIAAKVGTVAHTASLHRETVGEFGAGDMLDLSTLEADAAAGAEVLQRRLLPPDAALKGFPALELDATMAAKFSAGQEIWHPDQPQQAWSGYMAKLADSAVSGSCQRTATWSPNGYFTAGKKTRRYLIFDC
jgi:tRNA pseudouridine55 synthase